MSRRQLLGMLSSKEASRIWEGDGARGLGLQRRPNLSVQLGAGGKGRDGRIVSSRVLGEEPQLCDMESARGCATGQSPLWRREYKANIKFMPHEDCAHAMRGVGGWKPGAQNSL